MYFYGLIIPVLSFILQIWPRLIKRYFGIDTWRHLLYADYVRKNKKLPKSIKNKYLVEGPYGYPPFIILLLSLFSKKFTEEYQFIFSPVFDFIHNYLIFLTAFILSKDILVAITAQVIAALTPLVVIEASNLSTRTISYLVFSVSFFSLIMFSVTGYSGWFILSFISLFLLFFTHRFAIQAYLFQVIGFSIIEGNLLYILFFLMTYLFVIILGGNTYRAILNEHLAILNYWRKNIDFRFAHQFRGVVKNSEMTDFVYKIYILSTKNPYIYIFGNNPWLGIFILGFLFSLLGKIDFISILPSIFLRKFELWIAISVMSSLLILSIKRFRFLGEGHRYIEYSVFPLALVLSSYFSHLVLQYRLIFVTIFFIFCFCILTQIIYLQYKTIIQDRSRTISRELREIINYLNKNYGNKVNLGIFPFQMGDAMAYFLKGKILTTDNPLGLWKLIDLFPIVKIPLSEIIKRYKINFLLFDSRYVSLEELRLRRYKIIKKANDYMLIKV